MLPQVSRPLHRHSVLRPVSAELAVPRCSVVVHQNVVEAATVENFVKIVNFDDLWIDFIETAQTLEFANASPHALRETGNARRLGTRSSMGVCHARKVHGLDSSDEPITLSVRPSPVTLASERPWGGCSTRYRPPPTRPVDQLLRHRESVPRGRPPPSKQRKPRSLPYETACRRPHGYGGMRAGELSRSAPRDRFRLPSAPVRGP